MYFPKDNITSEVNEMIQEGISWEESRVLTLGNVNTAGNSRTGLESGPNGKTKTVDWRRVVNAFAWQYQISHDLHWLSDGQKVAQHYFQTY